MRKGSAFSSSAEDFIETGRRRGKLSRLNLFLSFYSLSLSHSFPSFPRHECLTARSSMSMIVRRRWLLLYTGTRERKWVCVCIVAMELVVRRDWRKMKSFLIDIHEVTMLELIWRQAVWRCECARTYVIGMANLLRKGYVERNLFFFMWRLWRSHLVYVEIVRNQRRLCLLSAPSHRQRTRHRRRSQSTRLAIHGIRHKCGSKVFPKRKQHESNGKRCTDGWLTTIRRYASRTMSTLDSQLIVLGKSENTKSCRRKFHAFFQYGPFHSLSMIDSVEPPMIHWF